MSELAWGARIAPPAAAGRVRQAQALGLARRPALLFHDLARMCRHIQELEQRFPPGTLHALAVKANPLVAVLREAVAAGAGLECASLEEVHLALAAGCAARRIVFDSPAKSRDDLELALALGIYVNADNEAELDRIAELGGGEAGLRINPQVGRGSIDATSVAAHASKFGMGLVDEREAILAAFRGHAWLRGLHVHVGSQGCDLDLLVRAAARVAELREEIDAMLGEARIGHVDIGGGLPVAYGAGDRPPSLDEYVARLRAAAPSLLDGRARLITELGRAVQAGCGFAATRVEYVKEGGGTRIAVGHLGADLLLRPVYNPQDWRHELVVLDAGGTLKDGPTRPWSVAGPLCFAGDFIARDVELPEIVPGDWLLIRDTGAYTLSMWSRHCSRALPPVVGFRGDEMWLLHEGEEPRDVVAFWGG